MSDIPEDILAAAENANTMGWHQDRVKSIALAILAERERCARIAREEAAHPFVAVRILSPDPKPPVSPSLLSPLTPAAETSTACILPAVEGQSPAPQEAQP